MLKRLIIGGRCGEGINELRELQALISRMRSHERLGDIVGGRGINGQSS